MKERKNKNKNKNEERRKRKKKNNRLIDCIQNLFDAERTFFYR